MIDIKDVRYIQRCADVLDELNKKLYGDEDKANIRGSEDIHAIAERARESARKIEDRLFI